MVRVPFIKIMTWILIMNHDKNDTFHKLEITSHNSATAAIF